MRISERDFKIGNYIREFVNETISFINSKEMARDGMKQFATTASVYSYKSLRITIEIRS